jgi:CheY-like chemotaxis protein/tRNA A-37 threonylcarbamoyl transferase component Bud32
MTVMPETISREEFLRALSESELLSEADLRAMLDGAAIVSDAKVLARRLVHAGRLTQFQSDAIFQGRAPELSIGNYIVIDRLGSGGMGTVFKARHRRMNRVVALKFLSNATAGQTSFAQRFEREIEIIAQLSHPNIVMAFDAGESRSGLYLVMEFVDGTDLGREVAQGGAFSTAKAVDCILQAARGLACAHDHGIVHRDVKPANLLHDTAGVVKVADLGLARPSGSEMSAGNASLTQVGVILGTAEYMAPEQALDSATVDHRVDVYSLGCTLFFLLTARAPYSAGSLLNLLLKHRDDPIPSLREVRRDVPAELDEICRRMVGKRPEDRYPTMAEVVHALEGLQTAGPATGDAQPAASGPVLAGVPAADATVLIGPMGPVGSLEFEMTAPPSNAGDAPTPSDVRHVARLRVVLVEPSRAQASIVRQYLQALGIENVRIGNSGRQALELARDAGTDVILSSLHLADMTGVQLAQALHADPACAGVGFVLASSESDGGEASKLLGVARTVLLQKPFDLRGLAEALARATGRVDDVNLLLIRNVPH